MTRVEQIVTALVVSGRGGGGGRRGRASGGGREGGREGEGAVMHVSERQPTDRKSGSEGSESSRRT